MCLTFACESQRTVIAGTYSISGFQKLSHHHHGKVVTQSGDYFYAHHFQINGDSIHFEGGEFGFSQSQQNFSLSEIQKIRLTKGPSWKLIGFASGLAAGLTVSALIFHHDAKTSDFPTYGFASFLEIPPLTSILGLVIGNGFDQPDTYAGDYYVVPEDSTYRFQQLKQERQPPAQTNPVFE